MMYIYIYSINISFIDAFSLDSGKFELLLCALRNLLHSVMHQSWEVFTPYLGIEYDVVQLSSIT